MGKKMKKKPQYSAPPSDKAKAHRRLYCKALIFHRLKADILSKMIAKVCLSQRGKTFWGKESSSRWTRTSQATEHESSLDMDMSVPPDEWAEWDHQD